MTMPGNIKSWPFGEGKGQRPECPFQRIIWAAKRGTGCTLSAEEVWELHLDNAVETRATVTYLGLEG